MKDWRNKINSNPSTPTDQEKLDEQWKSMSLVGRNVFRFRKEKGWSQEKLAIVAGVQTYQICYIEGSRYYNVSFFTLCLLARALGVSVSDLVSAAE